MSTRYRLPDGTEVPPAIVTGPKPDFHVWIEHPTLGSISVDSALVSEVKPPLPPEPPNGTVLSNGIDAFIRCDDENNPGEGAWYCTGDKQIWTWAEVAPTIDPGYRSYVPDPAADAPELPWKLSADAHEFKVYMPSPCGSIQLALGDNYEDYDIDDAERIAVAILGGVRAAREVEQP